MRKTLCGLFLLFCVAGKSQITKGNWLVGGNGKFYTYKGTFQATGTAYDSKYLDLDISAPIGYFIADKFAAGIMPSFSWIKGRAYPPGGGSTNIKRISIGPMLRYYLLDIEKQYNIVTQVAYQFGANYSGFKGTNQNFSALAGPVLYFNSSVGLEFLLGYNFLSEDIPNAYKTTRSGFQVGLGFQIHLEN